MTPTTAQVEEWRESGCNAFILDSEVSLGTCGAQAYVYGYTHPAPFVPITADMVTDEMVNEYLTFMGKASYLRHPDVPYLGTAKNDSPEEWKLRFSKAAFAAAVNAWGAKK